VDSISGTCPPRQDEVAKHPRGRAILPQSEASGNVAGPHKHSCEARKTEKRKARLRGPSVFGRETRIRT